MATKTFTVTKQFMADTVSGNANSGDLHVVIGAWAANSYVTRANLYAPVSFSGMTGINSARLYLRANAPASGFHAKGTSTADINARRKTADWSEANTSVSEFGWGGDYDDRVEANFAGQISGDGIPMGSLTDGTWYYIPITGIVQAWFNGSANYGVMVYNDSSESSSSFAKQFYSRHSSGNQPYIWIDYNTNTAPNAPVSLTPTGNAVVHTGTTITYSGTRSDPDSGDYISGVDFELFKDDGTTKIYDFAWGLTGVPTTFSRAISLPSGYKGNTYYKWRARTKDKEGVYGPFSALQRFKANTVPNVPSSLDEETDTLTPTFSGGYSDPDPSDGMTGTEIEVYNNSTGALMWDSGTFTTSGTSWSKIYAGSALAWNTTYKWRARVKDSNGAYSSFSAYRTFTTAQPAGPTLSPRTTTAGVSYGGKQNSTTPTLTITYTESFKNHEVYVYTSTTNSSGVKIPTTTVAYSFTGGADYALATTKTQVPSALTRGNTYFWKARVKLNDGTWTQFGGMSGTAVVAKFYINALPTAPTELTALNASTQQGAVVRDSDGVHIVTTVTPFLEAVYNDPDLAAYNDLPSARKIEIYDDTTGALVHTNENLSPSYTDPMAYAVPASVLAMETTYKVRWQFQDNSDVYGAWSSYLRFKCTQPSALASVTPTGSITSPSFTVAWSHTSPGGKAQGKYRVQIVRDSDDVIVYDTGYVASSTESHVVPGGYLKNSTAYTVNVEALDTDNL